MKKHLSLTLIVAVGLGFMLGVVVLSLSSWAAAASSDETTVYSYLHFTAGTCQTGQAYGQGVIDMRTGKVYCVPYDGSEPVLEGTLNLAAIPKN